VPFDKRTIFSGVLIAGLTGPFLLVPAVSFVGSMLTPSHPAPAAVHAPPLLADAIWARANGGRATQLQPINPFTVGRTVSCLILAERLDSSPERDARQEECMTLLPAVQAIGYLTAEHMKSDGVWQDPRVPFVQIAHMTKVTSTWSRPQLVDTLAERAEFGAGFRGAEQAARGFFNRRTAELTLPQAALLAAVLGERRADPWCTPEHAARVRRRVLQRMRDNLAIDDPALEAADRSDLGLAARPADREPCPD
jgi:hypothetical protein